MIPITEPGNHFGNKSYHVKYGGWMAKHVKTPPKIPLILQCQPTFLENKMSLKFDSNRLNGIIPNHPDLRYLNPGHFYSWIPPIF